MVIERLVGAPPSCFAFHPEYPLATVNRGAGGANSENVIKN
jgi:hypothetical protein